MASGFVSAIREWRIPYLQPDYTELQSEEGPEGEPKPMTERGNGSRFWAMIPFFIAKPLGLTDRSLPKRTSTSYLNGLRGAACVAVLNQHFAISHSDWIYRPWGSDPDNYYVLQLPFLRLAHCGVFMVGIFFVLSGFVLSFSSLRRMAAPPSADRDAALLTGLSSSLLRRPLRLFVPMLAAISLTAFAVYIYPDYDTGGWRDGDPSFPIFWWRFMAQALPLLNPYSWSIYAHSAFTHAWTMQMEYRGSIVIFLLCLLTCKLSAALRKVALAFVAWQAMACGRWEVFCFIEGMIIAELRHAPLKAPSFLGLGTSPPTHDLPIASTSTPPSSPGSSLLRLSSTKAWAVVLAFGLLVGGWPPFRATTAQPYRALYAVTPAAWASGDGDQEQLLGPTQLYWVSVGAGLTVLALEGLPHAARAIFDTRPMAYLGEISFSFYLLHQPLVFCVGVPWYGWLRGLGCSVAVAGTTEYLLVVAVLLCAADLFWRTVDEKAVEGSRRFARWCGL